jgi:serine protease Do
MTAVVQEHIARAPGMNAAASHLAAALRASTVEIRVDGHGNGSGVIWRKGGLIVTNAHVVRGDLVDVILADGRRMQGQVMDRSDEYDLAAVRISADNLEQAVIGDSSELRTGQLVLAMGHPLGVKDALSMGIVHMAPSSRPSGRADRWIQADLSLLPGNSGGPLANADGQVIGINSMVAGGLALAVPSNVVERFVSGQLQPAFLGVLTQEVDLTGSVAASLGVHQESGLMVLSVVEGGPAARNGLLPGDILVVAAKWPLTDHDALMSVLRQCAAGTPLPLVIIRAGTLMDVTTILGERETGPTQQPAGIGGSAHGPTSQP